MLFQNNIEGWSKITYPICFVHIGNAKDTDEI